MAVRVGLSKVVARFCQIKTLDSSFLWATYYVDDFAHNTYFYHRKNINVTRKQFIIINEWVDDNANTINVITLV